MRNEQKWSNVRKIMKYIIKNTYNDGQESISQWIGNIGSNQDTMLLLVGNKAVSEDFVVNKTIQALFDTGIVKHLTDESLSKQSLAEIVNGNLFLHINNIPNGKEEQQKLEELITSVVIHKAIISNGHRVRTQAKIIVTIDEPHAFFGDFLEVSTTLFIDSKENILSKFKVNSTIPFYQAIESSLDYYSEEIKVMEKGKFDIKINENQRYIDLLNEGNVVVNEVSSNNLPILDPYSDDFEKYFPMGDYHTYITGQTRMGKSTLLTILFHRYIQRTNSNVILFDVHGDLAKKAKMLVKDKSRLLYISNTLDKSHAASINLFKLNDKSEKNISKMANVILGVIKQVKTDEVFSGAMEELLLRCIRILLRKSDGSFRELYRFTNDKRNSDLVEYAKKCGDILDEEYFQDYFNDTNTKNAVRRRLSTLLNDEDFINMMSGDKCIDFEKEFNTPNKIIIIDISKGSMDSYIYYIRFIIEYISILALKRVDTPKEERVITHLILDEFDNFISSKGNIKTILKEAGKYNLLLTIAHQIISDIKDSSLRDTILSMTGAKVIFNNSNQTLEAINKTLNKELEDVENLNKGEFYVSVPNNDIVKMRNTDSFLDSTEEISNEQWEEHKQYQLAKYYRYIKPKTVSQTTEEELKIMIQQFKADLISKNLTESSCLYKLQISAPERFKEIKNDFEFRTPKDNEYKPRIRQQEISVIFSLAFELDYTFDNAKFIQMLKGENDMFNQSNSGTRTAEFTIDGKSKTEQYYYFQW
ncbi:type IV secretion system DNA-binding domain-containing protein [Aliarcobacter cryaerophilus]|uniref:ATP-binding protein n=1 Tax=Aliarcobacter cryaerophilus TaxID=28198 RepID=UPI003DA2E4A4